MIEHDRLLNLFINCKKIPTTSFTAWTIEVKRFRDFNELGITSWALLLRSFTNNEKRK